MLPRKPPRHDDLSPPLPIADRPRTIIERTVASLSPTLLANACGGAEGMAIELLALGLRFDDRFGVVLGLGNSGPLNSAARRIEAELMVAVLRLLPATDATAGTSPAAGDAIAGTTAGDDCTGGSR